MDNAQSSQQPYQHLINLADSRLGAVAISVTDDWFADVNRMLQATEPEWKEGVFDDNGKWMDGWESRRKRHEGYDNAVIKLGVAGIIQGVDIDTRYFTGNYPPSASIDACYCENSDPDEQTQWTEILSAKSLSGDSHHFHPITASSPFTHIRLNIFPDGGVARLKVFGTAHIDWDTVANDQQIDLLASLNGGRAIACNDQHFGHMSNLINPGRGINMGDGWETARRRTPGNDWVILALAHPGIAQKLIVDTKHFKGNYPDSVSIQGAYVRGGTDDQIECQSLYWQELLPQQKLEMDSEHEFTTQLLNLGPITHIKMNIFPDGGVSRLRLFGLIQR